MEIGCRVYKPRRPRDSPLFRLVERHLEELLRVWPERFARRHGPLRGVVERVLRDFLRCGLLDQAAAARELFSTPLSPPVLTGNIGHYAVSADGQRFLLVAPVEEAPTPIMVLVNSRAGLQPRRSACSGASGSGAHGDNIST